MASAPPFAHLLPTVTTWLAGAAVAGHNVKFDLAFIRAEYARAGWALPYLPALCTLEASWMQLPALDRRRLADCCAASGIRLDRAHSALGDARATAVLLASYLDPTFGSAPDPLWLSLPKEACAITWPTGPSREPTGATAPARTRAAQSAQTQKKIASPRPAAEPLVHLLQRLSLTDALDEGAPTGSLSYLQLLAEALEDGVLTDEERTALAGLAELYELTPEDLAAAHKALVLALAHLALDDGRVTRAERAELAAVAGLLGVPESAIQDALDAAEAARTNRLSAGLRPLPADWTLGDPLRVGDKVAFTGCGASLRDELEQRAQSLGVRVMNNVSRRTAMLVTDGTVDGTKARAAAECGTRCVTPEDFAVLLWFLQPAAIRKGAARTGGNDGATAQPSATHSYRR